MKALLASMTELLCGRIAGKTTTTQALLLTIVERWWYLCKGTQGLGSTVGYGAGLSRSQVVDEEAAAVLDGDGQGEEAAVVQRVRVDGEVGVRLVSSETPGR